MFKQKNLSGGARFGLWFASLILGILLFASALSAVLIISVRTITSQDGLSSILRTVISAPAQVHPKAPSVVSGEGGLHVAPRVNRLYQMPHREEPGSVASSLTDQLIGMFYEEMNEQFEEGFPVSQEEFTQMIHDSTVKDYIADKTAALITDFFNDEITTTFEPEEVVQLIEENSALIESITGQPIPENIAEEVAKVFDENEIIVKVEKEGLAGFMQMTGIEIPGISGDSSTSNGEGSESGFDLRSIIDIFNKITSNAVLYTAIAVTVMLIAAIILINCHQLSKGLRRAGYPLMVAGSMVVLNLLAKFNPEMWVIETSGNEWSEQALAVILKLARHILVETAAVNIVVFSVGLALVIAGITLSIVLRIKAKSPVSIPSTPETDALAEAIVDETPVEFPEAVPEEMEGTPTDAETPENFDITEDCPEEPTPVTE